MLWLASLFMVAGYIGWVVRGGTRRGVYRYHLIKTARFRVFLHRADSPDLDRHLHNHPWLNAWSLILRGGYIEHRRCPKWDGHEAYTAHQYLAGSINRLHPDTYHKIAAVLPGTWTLFFAGRSVRRWGFMTAAGHVDWKEYRRADGSRVES